MSAEGHGAHGIVAQLAKFAAALRDCGVRVGLTDEVDAAAALVLVDLLDRAEVHRTLRIVFKLPRDAWEAFDRLFEEYWDGRRAPEHPALREAQQRDRREPARWRWDGERVRIALPDELEDPQGEQPGYSPEAVLRRKPFDQFSESELAAMERLLARLALKLATRRSRRRVPTLTRGTVDLRRSFRSALASDGEFLKLARRARPLDQASLVILYDTSGSMDAYTRVLLAFAFALRRVMKRVEIFAFNTTLVRATRMIAPAGIPQSLSRLAAGVPDWSGGTRIGGCLAEFVNLYKETLIDRNTTVICVSDGLDHGDSDLLEGAMRELRARAGKIIWLNPLLGDSRYRPEAAGMRAALPFVDHFGPAHNLKALEGLLRFVG
ncbi:MAG TPA: VWA domain-containing protein [Burkholderiales bacterium]|nr:VWA domain-containing protein [Burkholderiales bacterium]